jgi:hypothetical protein
VGDRRRAVIADGGGHNPGSFEKAGDAARHRVVPVLVRARGAETLVLEEDAPAEVGRSKEGRDHSAEVDEVMGGEWLQVSAGEDQGFR